MPETPVLEQIQFVAGPTPDSPSLTIPAGQVIVLVGPNNSGKSTALRELDSWAAGKNAEHKVIEGASAIWPPVEDAWRMLLEFETKDPPNPVAPDSIYVWVSRPGSAELGFEISWNNLEELRKRSDDQALRYHLLSPYTLRLDGKERFNLASPQQSGDLDQPARNHLWRLLQSESAREEVRELISGAFGLYFFVDMTGLTELKIRMAEDAPPEDFDELSVRQASKDFASSSVQLTELGDGVQAYTGLVSAIVGIPSRLILIDEPEAFLHPLLSRRLGSDLSRLIRRRQGTMVVSTHSSNFLMGCIEESEAAAIVRLTHEGGTATARTLDSSVVAGLLRDPMLRSTGALDSLFHRAAVVVEGDSDRAFYAEVNRRLDVDDRGVKDCLFLNAQNWQTTAKIVGPLRRLGIPVALILDFDVIYNSESWAPILDSVGMDPETRPVVNQERDSCRTILSKYVNSDLKKRGLGALTNDDAEQVRRLISALSAYGVFIVSVGSLESWLGHLGVDGFKSTWVPRMFNRMGSDPDAEDWVRPSGGDVWAFMDGIATWVADPGKKGIPDA